MTEYPSLDVMVLMVDGATTALEIVIAPCEYGSNISLVRLSVGG